jgi:predicted dehydrogenase
LKVAVIGYGSIGRRHVQNLSKNDNLEIIVFTQNKNLKKLKKVTFTNSLNKCLQENPEIAFITNETSKHVNSATKMAKNNCHLFIEKPLSNSIKGLDNLSIEIKKRKLITLIGCNLRFHPCIKKMKQFVSNGKIGKVLSVKTENGSYLPNWHKKEDYSKRYAAKKDLGGEIVLTCIHEIDYLYWIFGQVSEVFSMNGKFSDLNIEVSDLSSNLIRFRNNVQAELHHDYFQQPASRNCKIIGTKGSLYLDLKLNTIKLYNLKYQKWSNILNLPKYDNNLMYEEEIKHFFDCIKYRKETINDVKQGIETLRIALGIINSSKKRKVEKIK